MVLKICPRCNVTYMTEGHVEDFAHECNSGSNALDNEDVVSVSNSWEDYTGSGVETNVMMKGGGNKMFGTRAEIEGGRTQTLTKRGNSAQTHRVRQHLNFNVLEGGDC